jgi:hypothetical protein
MLKRILAILRYAYPEASSWDATFEPGYLRCLVDGKVVPAPPKEAYGG